MARGGDAARLVPVAPAILSIDKLLSEEYERQDDREHY